MSQIKSKLRVKELAEVYTNEREVNAMLDLVKDYSYDIEKKFFEPACGNGNFLIKILERKLSSIENKYFNKKIINKDTSFNKTFLKKYEFDICLAVSSIYAVDICPENVKESIDRLFLKIMISHPIIKRKITSIFVKERIGQEILEKLLLDKNCLNDMDFEKLKEFIDALVFNQYNWENIDKNNLLKLIFENNYQKDINYEDIENYIHNLDTKKNEWNQDDSNILLDLIFEKGSWKDIKYEYMEKFINILDLDKNSWTEKDPNILPKIVFKIDKLEDLNYEDIKEFILLNLNSLEKENIYQFETAIQYILEQNIIQGNTLDKKDKDENELIFTEFKKKNSYDFIIKRYLFSELFKDEKEQKCIENEIEVKNYLKL